jgi:hypothetical protein
MQMDEARHSTLAILAAEECEGEVRAVSTVGAVGDDLMRLIPRLLSLGFKIPGVPPGLWVGVCRADRPGLGSALEGRDDLRPDRNHAQKQRQRGERGSFFNDGPNHDPTPAQQEQDMNIVHAMFQSQALCWISQKPGQSAERSTYGRRQKESPAETGPVDRLGRYPTQRRRGWASLSRSSTPRRLYRIDHHRKIEPDRATGGSSEIRRRQRLTQRPDQRRLVRLLRPLLSTLFWPLP